MSQIVPNTHWNKLEEIRFFGLNLVDLLMMLKIRQTGSDKTRNLKSASIDCNISNNLIKKFFKFCNL